MSPKKFYLAVVFIFYMHLISAQDFPFDLESWKIINVENNKTVEKQLHQEDEAQILTLPKNHVALLSSNYADFSIDFDIKNGIMPGIGFRSKTLKDYEYVYLRLGRSGKNDAIQYVPVYHGSLAWQVYNYPIYETTAQIKKDDWNHVKLEVYKDNMHLYVNKNEEPNMVVKLLQDKCEAGSLFLKADFETSYFKNVRINKLENELEVQEQENLNRYLNEWILSEQFEMKFHSQTEIYNRYTEQMKKDTWQKVKADRNGIINLSKYYEHPQNCIVAKTEIHADKNKEIDLLFDYTFSMAIILNQDLLFSGTELDTKNFMRVIDGEEKITLRLNKGKNELIFVINADDPWQRSVNNPMLFNRTQAMNWGFLARLSNYEGITLKSTNK